MSKNSEVIRKKKREKKKKKKERVKSIIGRTLTPSIIHKDDNEIIENKKGKRSQKINTHKLNETPNKIKKILEHQEVKREIKDKSKQVIEKRETEINEDKTTEDTIQLPTTEELYRQKKSIQPLNLKLKRIEDLVIIQSLINKLPREVNKLPKERKEFNHKLKVKIREIPESKVKTSLEKSYSHEILETLINREPKSKEQDLSDTGKKTNQEEIVKPKDSKASSIPPEEETIESIFEKIFKTVKGNFPSDIDTDNPYVVFLPTTKEDKYIDTLWIILREIFRKYTQKGKPISKKHDKKDYIEDELEAEDRIEIIERKGEDFVIYLRGKDKLLHASDTINKANISLLKNRLKELISQGFGFIVFHLSEELIKKIDSEIEKESWHPNIIHIKPPLSEDLLDLELKLVLDIEKTDSALKKSVKIKKKIASYIWGLIEPINDEKWKEGKSFDDFFCACERMFKKRLKDIFKNAFIIINNNKVILRSDPKVVFNSSEGEFHKRIKILVLKYLIEHKNLQLKDIKIEETLKNSTLKPDITINDDEVYEIETFYGRGDPEERIIELIKKYQKKSDITKLKIVIMNLDAILWYKEFIKIKNTKKKENMDIEFITLDLKNETLISIESLAHLIKNS